MHSFVVENLLQNDEMAQNPKNEYFLKFRAVSNGDFEQNEEGWSPQKESENANMLVKMLRS